ncbi:MAG: putative pilus biosis operon protein [Myxococcaceae bacterium]|nr:putative pilus biosis operon protein [Myxococcaceae bacterium]
MRRAHVRGQAATEFALGALVFITILVFGIHFAEVGYLSAKVHEAGAAAIWDSTAYRAYSFGGFADSNAIAAPSAAANAGGRYADWDGRASVNRLAPVMALTRAAPMRVSCVGSAAAAAYALPPLAPSFGEPGGVSCNAEGDFGVFRISTKFLEGADGFFKASNNSRPRGSLTTLCSAGRATGGTCPGALSILLGDDALTDQGSQERECDLQSDSPTGCTNGAFYRVTHATWDKSMIRTAGWLSGYTGFPERWARNIVGSRGIPRGQITGFYLSFRGEESGFIEPVEIAEGGGAWQSNPMDAQMPGTPYRGAYNTRRNCSNGAFSPLTGGGYCFLGKFPCN